MFLCAIERADYQHAVVSEVKAMKWVAKRACGVANGCRGGTMGPGEEVSVINRVCVACVRAASVPACAAQVPRYKRAQVRGCGR